MRTELLPSDYQGVRSLDAHGEVSRRMDRFDLRLFIGIFVCAVIMAMCFAIMVLNGVESASDVLTQGNNVIAATVDPVTHSAEEASDPVLELHNVVFLDDRVRVSFGVRNCPHEAANVDVSLIGEDGDTLVYGNNVAYVMAYELELSETGDLDSMVDIPMPGQEAVNSCVSVRVHTVDWHRGVSLVERSDLVSDAKALYLGGDSAEPYVIESTQ